MRKVFGFFLVAVAITLASCGNKTKGGGVNDSDTVAIKDTAVSVLAPKTQQLITALTANLSDELKSKDIKKVTSSLANLQVIYKNLVESGKLDEAKKYGSAVQTFIVKNADAIKNVATGNTTISSLIEGIKNLPTSAAATAEDAKNAVKKDAIALASPAIVQGATTVENVKAAAAAVENAPQAAKEAAANKVNSEITNAQNKAGQTIDKTASKANDAVNSAKDKINKSLGL